MIGKPSIDKFMQRELKLASKKLYGLVLGWFLKAINETEDLDEAISRFRDQHCDGAIASQRLYITVVSIFLKWCVEEKLISESPIPKIRWGPKKSANPKYTLSKEEVKALVDHISKDRRESGPRDLSIVLLMLHTGLRSISASNADIEDFDFSGGRRILRYLGKGRYSKDLFVVPPKPVTDSIQKYLKMTNRDWDSKGALFVIARAPRRRLETDGIRAAIDMRLRGAGLRRKGITTHSLRHTAASFAYAYSKDIKSVQDMLGHSSPVTTELYLHSINRVEKPVEDGIDFGLDD